MIKAFWFTVIVFFIVAYTLSGCVAVDEVKPEYCGPTPVSHKQGLHSMVVQSNPKSLTWEDIKGDRRKQFIAAFNATPPKSKVPTDASVRIYHRYDSLNLLVVVANQKGCVLAGQEFARPLVLLWLDGQTVTPKKSKQKLKSKEYGA